MQNTRILFLIVLLLCTLCTVGGAVQAANEDIDDRIQEDDLVAEQPANAVRFRNQFDEQQFERWIFQRAQNARNGRKQLETTMVMHIEAVDQLCGLTEIQRQKLYLAGRGDVARFFTEFEQLRVKFHQLKAKQEGANGFNQVWNQLWQDISPLQQKLNAGLFGESSLLRKVIRHTLDPGQLSKYEKDRFQRRKFLYHARLGLLVDEMERGMPLTAAQRREFLTILKLQTRPPKKFGHRDFQVMMLAASKLPADELKPIFDDAQWRTLQKQFEGAQRMETSLRRQKIID